MSDSTEAWYTIHDIEELDSPALVVYTERVKENIRLLKSMIDNPLRLRPHVKTNKTKEATRLMITAGIQTFKCATIAEAEMLGQCGAADVLLAYQPIGPKLLRFVEIIKKYQSTAFSCITDNDAAARAMATAFSREGITVPVYLDLNLGMNRTGIKPGKEAIKLFTSLNDLPGIRMAGLHAYDGHIRDKDIVQRTKTCNEAFAPVEKMSTSLKTMGYPDPVIIAGGSPTFPIHAARGRVICSPGTFIFWDKGYSDQCPEQLFKPAAILVTRVISLPDNTKICTDLGHKSVAAENELAKRVYFLNAPELKAVSQSEEHLVLEAGAGHNYKVGDVLYGLPLHICPTVALYERLYSIENGMVSREWRVVARDRKISV